MSDRMSLAEARELVSYYQDTILMQEPFLRAASTIVACGEVVERLDREYQNVHRSNPHPDEWTSGYLHALDVVEQWLEEALNAKDTE